MSILPSSKIKVVTERRRGNDERGQPPGRPTGQSRGYFPEVVLCCAEGFACGENFSFGFRFSPEVLAGASIAPAKGPYSVFEVFLQKSPKD